MIRRGGSIAFLHGWRVTTQAFIQRAILAALLLSALLPSRDANGQSLLQRAPVGDAAMSLMHASDDRGAVTPSMLLRNLRVVLRPGAAQHAALERFVADQQNPLSPEYHRWLTPEQFATRFGASRADATRVVAWLESQGMSDVRISRGGVLITFSGPAAAVESAFQTRIHAFGGRGRSHFANVVVPSVPAVLGSIVAGVVGLHDFTPVSQMMHAPGAQFVNGNGNSLGPADLATIYNIGSLYARGIVGQGITIAVLGQTPIGLSDYRAYRQMFGLDANDFATVEVPDSGPGTNSSDDLEEATLDVEVSGAVARDATILYVWGATVDLAAQYVIDNQLAQVMSLSYAACETGGDEFYQMLALQANAEGITWVSAAGDEGAAGCDPMGAAAASGGLDVMVPASAPGVTAVGGTAFTVGSSGQYWSAVNNAQEGSALSYVPETGWSSQSEVLAGGGGVSNLFSKPGYQSDFETATTSGRLVPDLSFAAAPGPVPYTMVYNGSTLLVAGTSAATPVFAGITALVNQYGMVNGSLAQPGLGNVNPVLYLLAEKAPNVFHDVTTGSNHVPCVVGSLDCSTGTLGYSAQSGYDPATGLGSVDAYALATNWNSAVFESSSAVLSASATQAQAEQAVSLTATVTTNGSPLAGSPTEFYYSNPQYQSSPAMLGSAVTDSTGRATITASLLPAGANSVTAVAGGSTTVAASPNSNAVEITVSAFPTSMALIPAGGPYNSGQTVTFTVNVSAPPGVTLAGPDPQDPHYFPGSVTLYSGDGSAQATATLSYSGSATLESSALVAGSNSFYALYSGNYYGASSQSAAANLMAAPAAGAGTTTALSASPAAVRFGNPLTLTAQVAAASGSAMPTGSVTFLNGSAFLATVALNSAGTASYTFVPTSVGTVTLTAVYGGSNAFDSSTSAPLPVSVLQPAGDFTITGASSVEIASGSTANVSLSIVPLNGFEGTIQLSCTGLASGDSCNLPATVTPAGTTAITLNLATGGTALVAGISFSFLTLLVPGGKRHRKRCAGLVSIGLAATLLAGCGGGTPHSEPSALSSQTYPMTVTGTSGSITHQLVIDVIVTP